MKLIIAENAGFCEGVERAYRIALQTATMGKPVYMLGNLVHNSLVIDKFHKLGIKTIKNLSRVPKNESALLIISAHGVGPAIYAKADKMNLTIIDTTCPWVLKAQRIVSEFAAQKRSIIIIGDRGHAEVKGLSGWSGKKHYIVQSAGEVEKIPLKGNSRIGVVAQTTQAKENFDRISRAIKKRFENVKIFNTICNATCKRQDTCQSLSKKADIIIVIGDKMSANTKRLFQLCKKCNNKSYWIQTASELKKEWFKNARTAGVTAGASTPDWVIKEITDEIETY